jgi:hypothetical protein
MWKDPIVEEVRRQRLEIERECGDSFKGISAQAMKTQDTFKDRLADRETVRLPAVSK